MQLNRILINLGFLEVFQVETQVNKPVYWQDIRQKQVHGPFKDAWTAMEHWRGVPSVKPEGEVIQVDFQLKRRM